MKEISGSIIILAASIILVAANYFDSLLFWILGALMLIDGYFIVAASFFFPEWLSKLLGKINEESARPNQSTT